MRIVHLRLIWLISECEKKWKYTCAKSEGSMGKFYGQIIAPNNCFEYKKCVKCTIIIMIYLFLTSYVMVLYWPFLEDHRVLIKQLGSSKISKLSTNGLHINVFCIWRFYILLLGWLDIFLYITSRTQIFTMYSLNFMLTPILRSKVKWQSKSCDMCGHTQWSSWPWLVTFGQCMWQRWPISCRVNNFDHTPPPPYGNHLTVPSRTPFGGYNKFLPPSTIEVITHTLTMLQLYPVSNHQDINHQTK